MQKQVEELVTFLKKSDRPDVQAVALQHILDFTGNQDTLEVMCKVPELMEVHISLLENPTMAKYAALNLLNISANEKGVEALLNLKVDITDFVLKQIMNPKSTIADACCMILSNITRPKYIVERVVPLVNIKELIEVFTKTSYNTQGQSLHYLGPVLSNLSQNSIIRKTILDQNDCIIHKLLPFTEYTESIVKRHGAVGTLRNCCFESDSHSWLLSESADILPRLLLPLAGNEEYDDEDNEKLPLDIQYLPNNKKREEDPAIRCMLLEALLQLCVSRSNREFIRNKNAYIILREYHKWEADPKCLSLCESLVNILIRTEEEIGVDNIKDIDIPKDVEKEFDKIHIQESKT